MPERPGNDASDTPVNQPRDKHLRTLFSNPEDAASLLRSCVPRELGRTLQWSTLTLLRGHFVSPDRRGLEVDLLYSVDREASTTPALLYVLLEHRSSPDRWLRLRLLNNCVQVWLQWHGRYRHEPRLPPIVPLVFYQGVGRWRIDREFAQLFANATPEAALGAAVRALADRPDAAERGIGTESDGSAAGADHERKMR